MKRALARMIRWASRAAGAGAALALPQAAGAQGSAGAAGGDLRCLIEHALKDEVAEIRGLALSPLGGEGRYTLTVTKSGAAGTSNVSQAGAFRLEPGGRAGVGSVNLSVERDARYEAVLTVELGGQRQECRASGPAEIKL